MRRLTRLKAKEISLTRAGANRRVVALLKSDEGGTMPEATSGTDIRDSVRKAVEQTSPEIMAQLEEIITKAEGEDGRELSARAAGVIKAIGRLLAPHAGEIKSSDIMEACKAAGLDSPRIAQELGKAASSDQDDDEEDIEADEAEDDDDEDEEDEDEEDEDEDEDEKDDNKAKKSANIAADSPLVKNRYAAASGKKAKALTLEPKGASVAKAAQATVEKAADLEDLRKSNSELRQQLEALAKRAEESEALRKAEKDARDLEDLKKSVSDNFGHLGVNVDSVAPALKALKDSDDKAHYDAVMEALTKSAAYRASVDGPNGIMRAIGHSRPGSAHVNAENELDELIKSAREKPEHSGKTDQQIYRDEVRKGRGLELKQRARAEARGEI